MFSTNATTNIYVFIIIVVFFVGLLNWTIGHYSYEPFIDKGTPDTSHTVNLPINTTYSCKNMCGPLARCSITGEQCSTDVDCYGCQPIYHPPANNNVVNVRGQNDAGKLTGGITPQYSSLTTDIGTQASLYNKIIQPPPQYNQGTDLWKKEFDYGMILYDKRYNPNIEFQPFLPKYPARTTLSGEFVDNGPLAANDYL